MEQPEETVPTDRMPPQDKMDYTALGEALRSPLAFEIIYSAMCSLRASGDQTIEEAISFGFAEWDC